MKIEYFRQLELDELPAGATATVSLIALKIENTHGYAQELISLLSDTSWISRLNAIGRVSFERTAARTIAKLVGEFSTVRNAVTSSFGQYLVSISAGRCLGVLLSHSVFPIAELWKEKLTNNHGFDFHTESPRKKVCFGEAKYDKDANPYSVAAAQVIEFIADGKDCGDAALIAHFASPEAIDNLVKSSRGFTVAFSLSSDNAEKILWNALRSPIIAKLIKMCDEVQIVGVSS